MLLFYFVCILSISAYDDHTSRIYIYEELPSNMIIISSVSLTNRLQWLPSSYFFQTYFQLNENQSLLTANHRIDREDFCEKKLCNCLECKINLNFLQIYSINNISIQTIEIIIQGKRFSLEVSYYILFSMFRY